MKRGEGTSRSKESGFTLARDAPSLGHKRRNLKLRGLACIASAAPTLCMWTVLMSQLMVELQRKRPKPNGQCVNAVHPLL
jgi:hypothetical protein